MHRSRNAIFPSFSGFLYLPSVKKKFSGSLEQTARGKGWSKEMSRRAGSGRAWEQGSGMVCMCVCRGEVDLTCEGW